MPACQFDRPETKDGMALAFRRSQCETPTCAVKLRSLGAGLSYEVFFEDFGIKMVKTGESLLIT